MAIDSDNEKLALITFHQAWNTPVPISSDGLDQADLQHLLWEYPGLLWVETALGEEVTFRTPAVTSWSFETPAVGELDYINLVATSKTFITPVE